MGLVNRLAEPGRALDDAVALAHQLAAFPQLCLRSDRLSAYEQWAMDVDDALEQRDPPGSRRHPLGRDARGRGRASSPARAGTGEF